MNLRIPKNPLLYFVGLVLLFTLFLFGFIIYIFFFNTADLSTLRPRSSIQPKTVSPKEDPAGKTIKNPSEKISFTFTEPLSPSDITAVSEPPLPLRVKSGKNPGTLDISPEPPDYWHPDVLYKITVFDKEKRIIDTYEIKVPKLRIEEVND